MNQAINVNELNVDTRKKLKLDIKYVPDRTIALGKVFTALQRLTTRDAYWVLKIATSYVPGYKRTLTHTRQRPKLRKKEVSK